MTANSDRDQLVKRAGWVVDRFTARLARRWRAVPAVDLEQVGRLTLIEQAGEFDPCRGVAFTTFVYRRVWFSMLDFAKAETFGVPPRAIGFGQLIARDEDDEHSPAIDLSGESQPRREALRHLGTRFGTLLLMHLQEPELGEDEVAELYDRKRLILAVRGLMSELDERQRLFLKLFYGDGRTLSQIAKEMGVSVRTVTRIHREVKAMITASFGGG